jgi:hypothetical protein
MAMSLRRLMKIVPNDFIQSIVNSFLPNCTANIQKRIPATMQMRIFQCSGSIAITMSFKTAEILHSLFCQEKQ